MMAAQKKTTKGLPTLSALLHGWAQISAVQDVELKGIALDSRQVKPGYLFLAVAGTQLHGVDYVAEALAAGAVAVVWEPTDLVNEDHAALRAANVPAVAVERLNARVSELASRFYAHPSRDLFVVGVTGTDGKTSCTHFIAQALHDKATPCGVLGTLGYGVYGDLRSGLHTTPDAVTLQSELAALRDSGAQAVAMEVSSHALDQARAGGVAFDVAVLTNLSRDHLDYHGTEAAYAEAKQRLFEMPDLGAAVLNLDDAFGRALLARVPATLPVVAYGQDQSSWPALTRPNTRWLAVRELATSALGLQIGIDGSWGTGHLQSKLLGRFNANNLLAALAVLLLRGIAFEDALARLATVSTVPGRVEAFGGVGDQPLVVVDYAHTPRALEQVLSALREHCKGNLWCVCGAGGERDIGKRPLMGAVIERLADYVVLTDDNPRNEDATQIVMDILGGMQNPDGVYVQRDRARAIAQAIASSHADDIVLIAGKGHEDYQQIGNKRLPFSDREQVLRHLQAGAT